MILVDENDNEIGTENKLVAHKKTLRHRALSVWVFNSKGETLLQRRARGKYHSGSLWSNTCCGHPRPGESVETAAERRLFEEMGFTCPLKKILTLIYKKQVGEDLWEFEYLHVFSGKFNGVPKPHEDEVGAYRWISLEELRKDIKENREKYSPWLSLVLEKISSYK